MNYEELIVAKNNGRLNKARQPIGEYYRQKEDGKFRGKVDIRQELTDSIAFTRGLMHECEKNRTLNIHHQLHFEPVMEGVDIKYLLVEPGNYMSFEQLLEDSPAVVASKEFLDNTLKALVEVTSDLHAQGIWHLCYSPRTVFARKGDNAVMLLSHGSFYQGIGDLQEFYGDDAKYVAPEVLNHNTVDGRSDVYSIGKFMESLFAYSEIPVEYKQMMKKATDKAPENRYERPEDMLKAMQAKRNTYTSLIMLVVAAVIALIGVSVYFELVPETHEVEFVEPAPRQATDDLLDDGFAPEELGVVSADSVNGDADQTEREYQAKAEAIFRKRYEAEADRILSKIYNTSYMSASEKQFMAASQETLKELMELQQTLGNESSLTPERSQLIASQIIERVTNEKKKALMENKK